MNKPEIRQITDARVLAALSHPVRRRLMDALKVYGPATVGQLAEWTEQAPANVSHHMRVLAAVDLVEEATEMARDRRERWWRRVSTGLAWKNADFAQDETDAVVASAAASLNLDRHVALARAWHAAGEDERGHWGSSPFSSDHWMRLTPDELAQLETELLELLGRWTHRQLPDDGQERRPVFVFVHGVPARP